jgi:hypothetical protein
VVASAVVVLGRTGPDIAALPVRLVMAEAVTLVSSDGSRRPGVTGSELRRGERVETAPGGAATLAVAERQVRLAAETTVVVPDGASVRLQAGRLLVDRRRGPAVTVQAGTLLVDRVAPGAVVVERGFASSVAVYSGSVRVRSGAGASVDVPALHAVGATGRALTPVPRPVRLIGDAWESLVVPDVVRADRALAGLAATVDTTGSAPTAAPALLTPFADLLTALPPGAAPSETVLPVAIGRASRLGDAERDRVATSVRLRGQGGSWGVVAALARAATPSVASSFADLLGPVLGPITPPAGADGPTEASGSPSAAPGRPSGRPEPTRTTGSPTPSSPTPTPSASRGVVEELVDTVEDLLPVPLPTPSVPLLGA